VSEEKLREALSERLIPFVWSTGDVDAVLKEILPAVHQFVADELRRLAARCPDAFSTPYGDRRCDLHAGHDGYHIRNDGCGRPEYFWGKP
jgi:hypothetical protein